MFLTKKHISRRATLKGLGVSRGIAPAGRHDPRGHRAWQQTAAAPKPRVGFFYIPHGAIMDNTPLGKEVDAWTPSGEGADFTLNKIMKPLDKYKQQLVSFANLENAASAGSVHTINPATWLSAVRPDSSQSGRAHGDDAGPGDRARRSARTPRCRRWSCRSETTDPAGLPAVATTAPRCRSATTTRRCRWNTTRARCSCSCSARAIPTPSAR